MKDTRKLTGELRRAITESVMKVSPTLTAQGDLRVAMNKVADEFYADYMGKHLDAVNSLPSGYFTHSDRIRVSTEKKWDNNLYMTTDRRMPACMAQGYIAYGDLSPSLKALFDKWHALREQREEAKNAHLDAETKLRNTLAGFTTVQKLKDAWPEILDHIPVEENKTYAMAIPVPEMNALLGLKKAA